MRGDTGEAGGVSLAAVPYGMGIYGSLMRPSATDSGALAPGPGWPGSVGWACRSVGHGKFQPRRRCSTGTPPGALAPTLRVWWTCRLEGVPGTCYRRIAQRPVDLPSDNSPRLPCSGLFERSGVRDGRSGVTPKRVPIPSLNGRAFESAEPASGRGMGWLAQKPGFACEDRARGAMVWLSLRSIQGWRLAALR